MRKRFWLCRRNRTFYVKDAQTQQRISLQTSDRAALRACLETTRGAAARDFGCGQGGLGRAQRPAAGCDDRTNAGHGQKTRRPEGFRGKGRLAWPCSRMVSELLRGGRAPRLLRRACHPAFSTKTAPLVVSKQALCVVSPAASRVAHPLRFGTAPVSKFLTVRSF